MMSWLFHQYLRHKNTRPRLALAFRVATAFAETARDIPVMGLVMWYGIRAVWRSIADFVLRRPSPDLSTQYLGTESTNTNPRADAPDETYKKYKVDPKFTMHQSLRGDD
jgi:hypothetical protein